MIDIYSNSQHNMQRAEPPHRLGYILAAVLLEAINSLIWHNLKALTLASRGGYYLGGEDVLGFLAATAIIALTICAYRHKKKGVKKTVCTRKSYKPSASNSCAPVSTSASPTAGTVSFCYQRWKRPTNSR